MRFFFTDNSFLLGVGDIILQLFLFIAFVYGVALFFYLVIPHVSQKRVFYTGLFLVGLATISHIVFFHYPSINERGILHLNASPVIALTYGLFSAAGLVPLMFAFAKEAIKKPHLRMRSTLFTLGLFIILMAGILVVGADAPGLLMFSFFIEIIGFVLVLLGVVRRPLRSGGTEKINR